MITYESFLSKPFPEEIGTAGPKQQRILSRKLFLNLLSICETVSEFILCAIAIALANALYGPAGYPIAVHLKVGAIAGAIVVALLQMSRKTYGQYCNRAVQETAYAIRISLSMGALLVLARTLLFRQLPIRAGLIACAVLPLLLMLQKHGFHSAMHTLKKLAYGSYPVAVYGAGETARRVVAGLLASPRLALRPVAVFDEDGRAVEIYTAGLSHHEPGIPAQSVSITPDLLRHLNCRLLIVTRDLSAERMQHLRTIAKQAGTQLACCISGDTVTGECIDINGLQLSWQSPVGPAWYYTQCKRMFDVCVSATLLLLLAPAFLFLSLVIRFTSAGPAFFVQRRVGRNGKQFKMVKFRSMCNKARPYELSPKTSHDRRITRIGAFLRKTSLDELPQLLNVFLGEMSLVGPRPEMPFLVRRYNAQQRQRLDVTPGITGLWQLSADRAYPIHHNIHHDLQYLQNRSFSLDLAILMHTVFFAMRGGV